MQRKYDETDRFIDEPVRLAGCCKGTLNSIVLGGIYLRGLQFSS